VYVPSPFAVTFGTIDVPWPWSGMKGLACTLASVTRLPLPSRMRSVHVSMPRAGGAGSASARKKCSLPCAPAFSRFA
jgi:hypothetical protein